MDRVGNFLRKKRKEKNLTQVEVSKRIGVSSNYVSLLEKGENTPSDPIIGNLAEVLDIPIDILYRLYKTAPSLAINEMSESKHLWKAIKLLFDHVPKKKREEVYDKMSELIIDYVKQEQKKDMF